MDADDRDPVLTVRVEPATAERIDRLAAALLVTRSEAARRALAVGVAALEVEAARNADTKIPEAEAQLAALAPKVGAVEAYQRLAGIRPRGLPR